MKTQLSFNLAPGHIDEFDELVDTVGCVENVELLFGIEFCCGLDNDTPVFLSDINDESLEKFDGKVVHHIFRDGSGKITDSRKTPCRFDITQETEPTNSTPEFSKPNIVRRGVLNRAGYR